MWLVRKSADEKFEVVVVGQPLLITVEKGKKYVEARVNSAFDNKLLMSTSIDLPLNSFVSLEIAGEYIYFNLKKRDAHSGSDIHIDYMMVQFKWQEHEGALFYDTFIMNDDGYWQVDDEGAGSYVDVAEDVLQAVSEED